MKSFIVLILAVVSGLQASEIHRQDSPATFGLIDHVHKLVEDAKRTAEKSIEYINHASENMQLEFEEQIKEALTKSYSRIDEIESNIPETINSVQVQFGYSSAAECLAKHRPELEETIVEARNQSLQCVTVAIDRVVAIRDELKNYTEAIRGEIGKLVAIIEECVVPSRPIHTVNCVIKNIGNIQKSIRVIVRNAVLAIRKATIRLIPIVIETRKCLDNVVRVTEKKVLDIVAKVLDCLLNDAPTTEAPTTAAPTTEAPTTAAPTTEAPTTAAPTTEAPTTAAPTTEAPTTVAPTTEAPTTAAPTTEAPTTAAPTTEAPTTVAPTTEAPTTAAPTTEAPTTAAPTTAAPTTVAPTTEDPITVPPTIPPTTIDPTPEV